MWSRNKELFLMPCLFAVFEICHRSHSPLCSLFQIPKPTKIQVKIGQLILSPLLEEICMEESAWRVGRPESAERPAFVSFCFILAMRSPPPVISFLCRFIPNPCQRIWEQMRSSLPPDAFVSAPRCVRRCSQIRSLLLPDSFASAPVFADRDRERKGFPACQCVFSWKMQFK